MPAVLVIEDEPAIAETILYALHTEGFTTHHVLTGQAALTHLVSHAVDCIILDVGLPDMNGFDLCRTIRKTHMLPILFLTARAEVVDRVVGLELGADDYMVKPFSPRELTARVRTLLRRGQPSAPTNAPTGAAPGTATTDAPFAIDDTRRQITFFGAPLELTRYEYRLLKVLVEHPGRVYSRDQLMDIVWDDATASIDRTVDAHIKGLRNKLRAIRAKCEPIRTHRGFGYSLRETL